MPPSPLEPSSTPSSSTTASASSPVSSSPVSSSPASPTVLLRERTNSALRGRAKDGDNHLLLAHHASATSPLRYTSVIPVQVNGWLAKEGRSLRTRRNRYFTLNGPILASHRSQTSPPSWRMSVIDAVVEAGSHPREVRLSFPARCFSFITPTKHAFDQWILALRRISRVSSRVDDYYRIGRLLGEGMNGQVRLAHDKMTEQPVAIKMIPRLRRQNETQFLAREIQIILSLSHPNLVKTCDVFIRTRRIHLVMEYLAGGELFDFISHHNHFTEIHAAAVMVDLLSALHYLHSRHIVHRDVKLENLLCANTTWPLNVKLADFGFANYLNHSNHNTLTSFVGTPYYIAPEMLRGDPHGCPVDVWAAGVVMYILLSGKFPFGGNNESEYYQRVVSKQVYFPAEEWADVSEEAKNLVSGMLCKDPKQRLTVEQCLSHPWLTRAQALLPTSQTPMARTATANHHSSEPVLRTSHALQTNPIKRLKRRYLPIRYRANPVVPDQMHMDNTFSVGVSAKHVGSSRSISRLARSHLNNGYAGSGGEQQPENSVNRRLSLLRRILSAGRESLDRYEGRFTSFRGMCDDSTDDTSANARKTLSLFSKDGRLRRSFHRIGGERYEEDAINFSNSQNERVPPKIARERLRLQKQQTEAAKRGPRLGIFGSRKFMSGEFALASQGCHSSPWLQSRMMTQAGLTGEQRAATVHSKIHMVCERGEGDVGDEENGVGESSRWDESVREGDGRGGAMRGVETRRRSVSLEIDVPAGEVCNVQLVNVEVMRERKGGTRDGHFKAYSRGRAFVVES